MTQDVARILGLSERQARNLLAEWVQAGWLILSDPARKSRRYRLSAEYRQSAASSSHRNPLHLSHHFRGI